jgi:ATP-dependent Zn protease
MEMNKIWQLLGLLLLFSCGSRNSHVNTQKDYKDSTSISKKESEANYRVREFAKKLELNSFESIDFEIIPNEKDSGNVANIVKISDKNGNTYEIPYNSNARVKFGANKVTNKTETKTNKEIDSVKKENQFLKAKLKSVQKSKVKETEKKAPSFWQTVFGVLGFSIIIILLWEMFKKNFLHVFNLILLAVKKLPFGKFKG